MRHCNASFDDHKAYDEQLNSHRKRKADNQGVTVLVEEVGNTFSQLRMPGAEGRDSAREGPQIKLQLCMGFEKTFEDLGGSEESRELVLRGISSTWNLLVGEVEKIIRKKAVWAQQCEDRGVIAAVCRGMRRNCRDT